MQNISGLCHDCDRLQIKATGTASERPQFRQPTKYDHYENFQKFKQSKEDELNLKRRKEELLKFNPNFTDFHLNSILTQEELDECSTEDIAKFCNKFRVPGCDHQEISRSDKKEANCNKDLDGGENYKKSLQKSKSLLVLTRFPVKCPISFCERMIGVTFVLSHYLRDHNEQFGVPCQEIYANKRSVLIFDPSVFKYQENVCLGILAYGGEINESSSRPTERGICISNAFLPKPYEHLATHLPVLIMACPTSWSALLGDKGKEINEHDPNFLNQELLVLWLVSPQTVKPIHCTVTVFDKSMTSSRSSIMKIRDLNDNQIPHEFMPKETNYMRLSHGEINILSQQRKECIRMEIMINEY